MKTYFVQDIKHLFYIIFCDFNFCGPELTAEITGYTVFDLNNDSIIFFLQTKPLCKDGSMNLSNLVANIDSQNIVYLKNIHLGKLA